MQDTILADTVPSSVVFDGINTRIKATAAFHNNLQIAFDFRKTHYIQLD